MSETLTVEEVRVKLLDIVHRFPNAMNPSDAVGRVLYTSPGDPPSHCIVGQLAAEEGWDLPPLDDQMHPVAGVAADLYQWPIDPWGIELLTQVQEFADQSRCHWDNPRLVKVINEKVEYQ